MVSDAYRQFLSHGSLALQQAVAEVAGRVPDELARAPTLDLMLRAARADAGEALRRYPQAWTLGFEESLARLVEDVLAPEPSRTLDLDALAIMDDERAQEEIEVVQAARVLGEHAGSAWHRLQRVESALRSRHPSRARSPLDPSSIGRALWRATERLPLSLAARSEAVRSAAQLLGPRLGPLYRHLVDTMERPGDAAAPAEPPASPRPPPHGPATGARRPMEPAPRFDLTRPGALMDLMDIPASDRHGAAPPSEFLLTQPLALEGDGARVPRLVHHHRDELAKLGTPQATSAAMTLIGRIFDEILADPSLSAEAVKWIGSLQPAVVHLAAEDAELLQNHRHPAWSLINQLATLFDTDAAQRPPNLDAWLERVVLTLRSSPRHARFEAINAKLAAWRGAQARSRLTDMAPTVELLQRHSQMEALVESARKRLERRLNASRADEAVRRFIASVWALVCAQEMAAGASPAGGPDAWDTATDLMWTTSPARSRLDAPTLVQTIPGLVERLKDGMARLGLDAPLRDAWLERLSALHLRALRRAAEEAQTDMPLTIDLALEDELPPVDERAAEGVVPLLPSAPAADPIAALQVGDRLALRVQGEWAEVALVWRSDNGHFLLFAVTNGSTLSITRRSFQRLLDEGLARLPDAGSALERAAQRIAAGLQ